VIFKKQQQQQQHKTVFLLKMEAWFYYPSLRAPFRAGESFSSLPSGLSPSIPEHSLSAFPNGTLFPT
jgi:hypothetical protein